MIDVSEIIPTIKKALEDDIGSGDITADLLPDDQMINASIVTREPMVLCGTLWVENAFKLLDEDIQCEWFYTDGDFINKPSPLCHVSGPAKAILSAERVALNFLQTLSATATQTKKFVEQLKGTKTNLLDTRKTLPGLRAAQKYAVKCGGGINHRMGLYDAFLIKENHIKSCGSITTAINKAKAMGLDALVEVEVETLDELSEALSAKPDRIMLDNFSLDMMTKAVEMNKPYNIALEASGNINMENIKEVAATGVDYISVGEITKSLKAIDLSLLIQ